MSDTLCISVTFLDPRFHGRADGGRPEWPPSPLRLFQALVAANGERLTTTTGHALRWLERQPPPTIVCPVGEPGQSLPVYVPNNAADVTAKAAARGKAPTHGPLDLAAHRTLKNVRPTHLRGGETVHYLWPNVADDTPDVALAEATGRLVALGWGIDLAVAQCRRLAPDAALRGERWVPESAGAYAALRTPVPGTLDALILRHERFLHRLGPEGFAPVPPLTTYRGVAYRRDGDPPARPFRVFELRHPDTGVFVAYPHLKLIHLAGRLRHQALQVTERDTPADAPPDWREVFVAGHRREDDRPHHQLSYLPLPSIGHRHTSLAVRRVLVAAPPGYDDGLEIVARRLAGRPLTPDPKHKDQDRSPTPMLTPIARDKVIDRYVRPCRRWASVTPVILPGHHDRKAGKTRRLIEKALRQAGIETPCDFTWSAVSRFPKSAPAIKPRRIPRRGHTPPGYLRPSYLLDQDALHLQITFAHDVTPAGPLALGSGRHCGLGLLAHHPDG